MSVLAAAIAGLTLFLAGLAATEAYDEWIATDKWTWRLIRALILAVGGVGVSGLAIFLGVTDARASAQMAKQLEEAQTMASKAAETAKTADQRARALEPRRLSPQERATILEWLKLAPEPRAITISSEMGDRETRDFAVDFEQLLRGAGWNVMRTEDLSVWNGQGPPPRGFAVEYNTDIPSELAKALILALHKAEIAFVPLRSRRSKTPLLLRVLPQGNFVTPPEWPAAPDVMIDIPSTPSAGK